MALVCQRYVDIGGSWDPQIVTSMPVRTNLRYPCIDRACSLFYGIGIEQQPVTDVKSCTGSNGGQFYILFFVFVCLSVFLSTFCPRCAALAARGQQRTKRQGGN